MKKEKKGILGLIKQLIVKLDKKLEEKAKNRECCCKDNKRDNSCCK